MDTEPHSAWPRAAGRFPSASPLIRAVACVSISPLGACAIFRRVGGKQPVCPSVGGGVFGGSRLLVIAPLRTSPRVHAGRDTRRAPGCGSLRRLHAARPEEPPSCLRNRPRGFPRAPAAGEGLDFPGPPPALGAICPFYFRRPSGDEVVLGCGSGFLFPGNFPRTFPTGSSPIRVSLLQGAASLASARSPEKSETRVGRSCLLRVGGDVLGGLHRGGTACLLSGDQTEGPERTADGDGGGHGAGRLGGGDKCV